MGGAAISTNRTAPSRFTLSVSKTICGADMNRFAAVIKESSRRTYANLTPFCFPTFSLWRLLLMR
jgi:hypothetical protein